MSPRALVVLATCLLAGCQDPAAAPAERALAEAEAALAAAPAEAARLVPERHRAAAEAVAAARASQAAGRHAEALAAARVAAEAAVALGPACAERAAARERERGEAVASLVETLGALDELFAAVDGSGGRLPGTDLAVLARARADHQALRRDWAAARGGGAPEEVAAFSARAEAVLDLIGSAQPGPGGGRPGSPSGG
ncbi:MAG: hypothetical protein IPO09_01980 [Anaeromyxobacter sp.]|nr:hypothetical protein [Anaeromyxobacter sp.]MBL0278072.1 hypothetical protein [Anaeromyxobacter sp.]